MSVTIEAGRFYRTDAGGKVGPTRRISYRPHSPWPFACDFADSKTGLLYVKLNGETQSGMGDHTTPNLIAEWTDAPTGPVRTVTRSEIVPGIYNRLGVGHQCGDRIWVGLVENDGDYDLGSLLDAGQLRALAATATEIADALEAPTQ